MDQMFGDREGYVAAAIGVGGYFNDHGSYEFPDGDWLPRFFKWPQQRNLLIKWAIKNSATADVYVLPMLRTSRDAGQHSGKGGYHCWADVDVVTPRTQRRIERLLGEGSLIVQSGRGLHVYVRLRKYCSAEGIEDLNRLLAGYLPADSKWRNNAVLRIPGTLNHKGRARGGEADPVVLEVEDGPARPRTPEGLRKALERHVKTSESLSRDPTGR